MSIIICKGCRGQFHGDEFGESTDFDFHDCPAGIPMDMTLSFDEWMEKAHAHAAEWRRENGIEDDA